jgi:hypothetical protein
MAIMVMGIIKRINKETIINPFVAALMIWTIAPTLVVAGDWKLTPRINLDETFTDNVELISSQTTSSFVTQTIAGLDLEYDSNLASFNWTGTQIYALYSHDSELNNSFRTLAADGEYALWNNGPILTASANIANISQNNASNRSADIVSGGTVEQKKYSTGLQYNFGNSSYSVTSSINYNITRTEDNIGDNNGFTAKLGSINGENARYLYWQLNGNYTKRKQQHTNNDGKKHTIEALLGVITSVNFNPFIRYYDENILGTGVSPDLKTTSSWGPGIRWLASPHIIIDLSYNFVADDIISDDYLDTSIQWEPSARTSLVIGYSRRFFGESYNLNLKHRTKRLTNSITYLENLEVFDRNSYREVTPDDLELIENNEFSLNKRFAWSSQLQLARTSFNVSVAANERTSLETNIVDETFNTDMRVTRTMSPRTNLSLSAKYNHLIYDKDNPEGSRQEDRYRTISANLTRNLASSLSYNINLQHVDRNSSTERFSYDEVRVMINITKEF